MKSIASIIMLISFFTLAACNKPEDTKLFETQRNALDKAKQVEGQMLQQTQEMQKNTEEQTK